MNELVKHTALTPATDFDLDEDESINGVPFAAFDGATESKWFIRKGAALPKTDWAVMRLQKSQIHWQDKKLVERITKVPGTPFEKTIDQRNAEIPEDEKDDNPFGPGKSPPWVLAYEIGLMNLKTGARVISSNSTFGQGQCFDEIRGAIKAMRLIRGPNVVPVVELSFTLMPTRYGPKPRPFLDVKDWIDLGGPTAAPALAPAPVEGLPGAAVEKPTASEIVGEPGFDPSAPAPKKKAAPAPRVSGGAPWDDGFPEDL